MMLSFLGPVKLTDLQMLVQSHSERHSTPLLSCTALRFPFPRLFH